MSNLPVTTGGGAVVSLPAGDVITGDVGDMSVDRGAPQADGSPVIRDLQRAVGFRIGPAQIAKAHELLKQYRLAEDQRQRTAAETAIRARWGAATDGNLVKIHGWILDTMGKELADEFLGARDSEGTGICNKPALLEQMLKAAHAAPAKRTRDNNAGGAPDPSAALSARLREIESWMGAPRGSADHKRYYNDPEVQTEYRNLVDQGVTNDAAHTADSDVKHRIAEIEAWMGARPGSADHKRYYNDPQIQQEYLQLQRRRQ